jgi:hypothetical protein
MSEKPSPLDFLKAVYLNEELPLSVRMRAAAEAAPYVHPKLGAIATTNMPAHDFAVMFKRAIARSTGAKLIEGKALPQTEWAWCRTTLTGGWCSSPKCGRL